MSPTLLGVFAHPDDESIACGGLLARCAALGVRVHVLSLTRGDAGPRPTTEDGAADLAALRSRELADAARALGIAGASALDYADGMLPWLDAAALEAGIREAITRIGADVVVTFGPDGLYWHPDHIAVHERATAAVAAMGDAAPALYYVTMPPGQMRRLVDHAGDSAGVIPGLDDPDAFGAEALPPTLVVHAGRYASAKLAAILAHRTQTAGTAFAAVTEADADRLLGTEHFRRAAVGRAGVTFVDALGVAPDAGLAAAAESSRP